MKKTISFLIIVGALTFNCIANAEESPKIVVKGQVFMDSPLGTLQTIQFKGELVTASRSIKNNSLADEIKSGFGAAVDPTSGIVLKACDNAVLVLLAEVGNFLPSQDGKEPGSWKYPTVLNFVCLD